MQPTQLLFQTDSYLKTFSGRVLDVEERNVVLDKTAFFPRGGGQMADRGTLRSLDSWFDVVAVEKRGDFVFHTLEHTGTLSPGNLIDGAIDWDFRYQMMRTHSALHVLCGVIYQEYRASVTGCQMYVDRARMDFTLSDLTRERVRNIEKRSNEVIREGRPVKVTFLPRAQANLRPELIRTKINLVPPHVDPVRVVEIQDLDVQADGGTHVANTLEIGGITITKSENKGRENRRLEIVLSPLHGGEHI